MDPKPFLVVAVVWGAISLALCAEYHPKGPAVGLLYGAIFTFFTLANLIFLVKMIEVTTILMSDQLTEKRGLYQIQLLVWVNLKLVSFGGLFFLIWKKKELVLLPTLLCGVVTLMIVPLLGGYLWSRKELKNE